MLGVAVAITSYLTLVKLSGGAPACAIVTGCDTVNDSQYSTVAGIPVAVFGLAASLAILVGATAWWRRADVRGLYLAYGVGLVSLPILAWLTYLEIAVIHAICIWCVSFAVVIIGGWVGGGRRPAGRAMNLFAAVGTAGLPVASRRILGRTVIRHRLTSLLIVGLVLLLVGCSSGAGAATVVRYERDWPDGYHEELTITDDGHVTMKHGDVLERLTLTSAQVQQIRDALAAGRAPGRPGRQPGAHGGARQRHQRQPGQAGRRVRRWSCWSCS